ncbi:MAG TPA: cation-translocating P-type ATPase [Castellaniella sp.]|uniref:heavy metal translocating P-type ATPase n=1 Tax=Castellaniella sp. TaxID=1955812 RepID=UPI002F0C3F64
MNDSYKVASQSHSRLSQKAPPVAKTATPQVGQQTAPVDDNDAHAEHQNPLSLLDAARIAVVSLAALAAWFHIGETAAGFSVIGAAGLAIGVWPVLKEAFEGLSSRRMTMELSMAIAIIAAAAISEFFTALIITLFVLVAEVLENMTVARGRLAIRELLDFLPRTVSVRSARGGIAEIEVKQLAIGDAILVNPGGRIPVDGAVTAGHSFVDQSRITGESMPAEKTIGSHVFAGSINQSGALEVQAEHIGRDTSFGKIIEAVEQAERSRAPVQRLADRLAGYLVYFALGAAVLTYFVTRDIRSTIAVVIVAGACGIAAGTPLAVLGAIGRAARAGAIIKGGLYLEQLGQVDTVVVDKTGTLTYGEPQVQGLLPAEGVATVTLLDAAAAAELRSEHPLGKTIVAHAKALGRTIAEPDLFDYTPGRGIKAMVSGEQVLAGNLNLMREQGVSVPGSSLTNEATASHIYVARAGGLLGVISVSDHVRTEAPAAMAAIHALGVQTVLLTGDTEAVAQDVASHLGITNVKANLLPDDKRTIVQRLVESGRVVAMVGDGINDAPALMQAQVGIAMGSGTDVARESADVVLLGNDLLKFAETLHIARRTRRIIWANFAGTIGIDLLGIGLAAFGLLSPLLAAFIHVTSEMVFILNSARLLPSRTGLR